jgi:hypothetical protein
MLGFRRLRDRVRGHAFQRFVRHHLRCCAASLRTCEISFALCFTSPALPHGDADRTLPRDDANTKYVFPMSIGNWPLLYSANSSTRFRRLPRKTSVTSSVYVCPGSETSAELGSSGVSRSDKTRPIKTSSL